MSQVQKECQAIDKMHVGKILSGIILYPSDFQPSVKIPGRWVCNKVTQDIWVIQWFSRSVWLPNSCQLFVGPTVKSLAWLVYCSGVAFFDFGKGEATRSPTMDVKSYFLLQSQVARVFGDWALALLRYHLSLHLRYQGWPFLFSRLSDFVAIKLPRCAHPVETNLRSRLFVRWPSKARRLKSFSTKLTTSWVNTTGKDLAMTMHMLMEGLEA